MWRYLVAVGEHAFGHRVGLAVRLEARVQPVVHRPVARPARELTHRSRTPGSRRPLVLV